MIYWVLALIPLLAIFGPMVGGFFMDRTLDRWDREDRQAGWY